MSNVMNIFKDLDTSWCVEMLCQYIFPTEIDTFVPICNMTILEIIIKNKTKWGLAEWCIGQELGWDVSSEQQGPGSDPT